MEDVRTGSNGLVTSNTVTLCPTRLRAIAADRPHTEAPTMTNSTSIELDLA